jgi:hypothetical protein
MQMLMLAAFQRQQMQMLAASIHDIYTVVDFLLFIAFLFKTEPNQ